MSHKFMCFESLAGGVTKIRPEGKLSVPMGKGGQVCTPCLPSIVNKCQMIRTKPRFRGPFPELSDFSN
jgi:hypothetical protein